MSGWSSPCCDEKAGGRTAEKGRRRDSRLFQPVGRPPTSTSTNCARSTSMLTNDLAASRQEALTFHNQFTETSGTLASTKASLQSAQDQITNLNSRIADLEAQNQVLDQRAAALTNTIASLNAQIADTEQKLAASETNNAFLEKELQRQMAAKGRAGTQVQRPVNGARPGQKIAGRFVRRPPLAMDARRHRPRTAKRRAIADAAHGRPPPAATAALRFERRSQLRRLHPRHSAADQRAATTTNLPAQ